MSKAVTREIEARLTKEREANPPIKRGKLELTANQWTLLVVAIFTVMAIVLNQFGLIH